jgi:hypothetical protein
MRILNRRNRVLLLAVLLAAACLTASLMPAAASAARPGMLQAEWQLTGAVPEEPVCHFGVCRQRIAETLVYSGDLEGSSAIDAVYITSDWKPGWVVIPYKEVFSGWIAGCGEGTVTFKGVITVSPTGDVSSGFVAVRGTGDLRGFSGKGSSTVNPDFVSGGTQIKGGC